MDNDKSNITIGLPKTGGAIFWAPLGTTLPTDASTPLPSAFVNLGYISEDGVTLTPAEENNEIKAWGKDTVMVSQESYTETVQYNLLETIRPAALQFIRGAENVVIGNDGSVKTASTGEPLPRGVLVVDTIQNNGSENPRYHRIVYGDCQVTDRSGDQTYNNSDPLMYPVTVTAYKFDSQAITGKKVYHDDFWTGTGSASA